MENTEHKETAQTAAKEEAKKYFDAVIGEIRTVVNEASLDDTIMLGHIAKDGKSRILVFGDKTRFLSLLNKFAGQL